MLSAPETRVSKLATYVLRTYVFKTYVLVEHELLLKGFVYWVQGCKTGFAPLSLAGFHQRPQPTPQFRGLKTGFGALVQGHPFAWVHISLGSTVLPQPPPKSSFGGLN